MKSNIIIKRFLITQINKSFSFGNYQLPNERRKQSQLDLPLTSKEYYDTMNEFEVENEGVPYGSEKYKRLRNKYHNKLILKISDSVFSKLVETGGTHTDNLRFYIIVVPEKIESYLLLSILNYNKILYKSFEDSLFSKQILGSFLGYEFRKSYKNYNFPFFQLEASSENEIVRIDNYNKIIEFLIENNIIKDFRTFSAYEQGGIEFSNRFLDLMKRQFLLPTNKISFYLKPFNIEECESFQDTSSLRLRFLSKIYRICYYFLNDFYSYIKERKNLKRNIFEENLRQLILEWDSRLNKNSFHGGDAPDEADFRVYSIIKKYKNCNKINNMIKKCKSNSFNEWEARIDLLSRKFINENSPREFAYVIHNLNKDNIDPINKKRKQFDSNMKGAFLGGNKRGRLNI